MPGSWRRSASPTTSFVERVRALGVEHELLDEGLAELAGRSSTAAPAVRQRPGRGRGRPAIARGLDYYTGTVFEIRMDGYESLEVDLLAAAATTRSPSDGRTTYPGVGISFGVSPHRWSRCWPTACWPASRTVPSAVLVALVDEESRAGQRRDRHRAAGPRHPVRGRGQRAEVRQADPLRRAPRHPVRLVHRRRRRPRGQGHPIGGAGGRRPGDLDPTHRGPATAGRSATRRQSTVIRTHDAGTLRAEHVGQTVTLAGWVASRRDHGGVAFIDLREASGVVQVVIRDEEVAHQLRAEYCLKVTGEVDRAQEGNENPNLRDRRDRGRRHRRRGAQRRRAAAVPDRRPRRRRRGGPAQAPLPRPAPLRPQPRAPAAQQGQPGRPRRARRATTSSRSRRRR